MLFELHRMADVVFDSKMAKMSHFKISVVILLPFTYYVTLFFFFILIEGWICCVVFPPEIKYSWVFNGDRRFLHQDTRRFISQRTGNLYIAKVEASDAGNYTCAVKNMMINATVFSSPTPVVVRRDGKHPQFSSAAPGYLAHWTDTHSQRADMSCFCFGTKPLSSWRLIFTWWEI